MQTHGGQAATDAIEGRERQFTPRLLVDWERDGTYSHPLSDLSAYASTITTDRNLAGTVPDEVALIEGAAAAELRATLGGTYDGESLVQVFSPYNGRSMFYLAALEGCQVSYSLLVHTALGTVEYPQFQGVVRSTSPDRGSNTVELEALDRVEQLRQPVSFPQWAVIQRLSSRGIIDAQLANTQWVIDHCLRHCDVSPTGLRHTTRAEVGSGPDDEAGVHLWLTGSGSSMPTRGWVDNAEIQRFPHTEAGEPEMYTVGLGHPDNEPDDPAPLAFNGMRDDTSDGYELRYWAQGPGLIGENLVYLTAHYLRATVLDDGTGYIHSPGEKRILHVNLGDTTTLSVYLNGSSIGARIDNIDRAVTYEQSATFPNESPPYHIVAAFDMDARPDEQVGIALRVNGTDTAWELYPWPYQGSPGFAGPETGLAILHHRLPLQDVAWASYNYADDATESPLSTTEIQREAAYRAVLDQGLNRLSYMPQNQDGSDAWDIITSVAAAEWGGVHWDETGVFRFWNYDTVLGKQTDIVRTVTVDDLGALSARRSLDSVRNVYSVEATKSVEVMGVVIDATNEDEFYAHPNTVTRVRVWDTSIVSPYTYDVPRHTTIPNATNTDFPTWNDDVMHGFVAQFLIGGTWQENNEGYGAGVFMHGRFDHDGYMVVVITNGNEVPARLATDNGSGAFRMRGTKTTDNTDPQVFQHRYPDSIAKYGERNMKLSGDWYQDGFDRSRMVDTMAERTTDPVPVTDQLPIPGDPRLQLGDTLEINDADGFGERLPAQIVGSKREFKTDGGLSETLTVQIIQPPGQWVLGSAAYSVLGQSTVLS